MANQHSIRISQTKNTVPNTVNTVIRVRKSKECTGVTEHRLIVVGVKRAPNHVLQVVSLHQPCKLQVTHKA